MVEERQHRNEWKTWDVWIIVGIALAARLVWLIFVHPVPASDFLWYHDKATDIARGLGYRYENRPTAYFPIGYPLFLAGLYRLFGNGWWVGVIANVLLNSLTAGLCAATARRLFGRACGWAAGLAMALYMPHIEWSSVLDSEMLFTFLFLLSNYLCILRPARALRWPTAAVAGIALGLACVVRPVAMLLPLVWIAYLLCAKAGIRRALMQTVAFTAGMALAIAPVTIRNEIALHHFIPVSTNGGVNLWQGNNPNANGEYYWTQETSANPFVDYVANEVEDNRIATQLAVQYITQHPGETLLMGLVKWRNFFRGTDNAFYWSVAHASPAVGPYFQAFVAGWAWWNHWLLIALAAAGLVLQVGWTRRTGDRRPLLLWLTTLYYILLFFIFPAWDRMRAPIEPWFAVFAAFAVIRTGEFVLRMRRRRGAAAEQPR